ncbi:MAG: hypothetical protein WD226_06260 [Planctomycetota bacterium]
MRSLLLASTLVLLPLAASPWVQGDDVPERTAAEPADALEARRLRALYIDLFGRPPTLEERARWLGKGAAELLDVALGEPEFWRNWLTEELYFLLLIDNFRPTSERVLALPERLAAGELGVRDALVYVALSASFDRRNPGPDTFVTVVLEQFRGENVQASPKNLAVGKKLYDGTPARFLGQMGRTQADVVRLALGDRHALEVLLARAHRRLLDTEPERRALGDWARRLERDPLAFGGIVREWLLSSAYQARLETRRTLPNHAFVRALFVDLTDRAPSDVEVDRIRGAMDGLADATPLRSVFARLLVDSGQAVLPKKAAIDDPTAWVAGLFERLLGRSATKDELRTFVTTFHEEACRPATILLALVTHPDYATW